MSRRYVDHRYTVDLLQRVVALQYGIVNDVAVKLLVIREILTIVSTVILTLNKYVEVSVPLDYLVEVFVKLILTGSRSGIALSAAL